MKKGIEILLETGEIIKMRFAECDFYVDGCDAAIDYTLYDKYHREVDGGQMDYCSDKKDYKSICDAIKDVMNFAISNSGSMELPSYRIL